MQPHQEILAFWRSTVAVSFREGAFVWSGPTGDSVTDAERLLCVLHPAVQLPRFRLDAPERTDAEALEALRVLGDRHTVPLRLIRAMTGFMTRYRDAEGKPTFTVGDGPDCVESFAISLRLSLAAIGFGRIHRAEVTDEDARAEALGLEELADVRLTAALAGLIRSFAVEAYDDDSPAGQILHRLIGQEHRDLEAVLFEYRSEQAEARARALEDLTIGSVAPGTARDLPYLACGWAAEVTAGAEQIEVTDGDKVTQRPGTTAAVTDLYFSWVALDAIEELSSPRTRVLGLLREDQSRLAQSLQLRLELTRNHWAHQAMFGDHRWPVERLPWQGSGGEGDYASLIITAIATSEVGARAGNNDLAFAYLFRVLARLATRHGIVRPPHADGSPPLIVLSGRQRPDFTVILFDTLIRAAAGTTNEQLRGQMTASATLVWEHIDHTERLSWCDTRRLAASLTTAVELADGLGRAGPPLGFVHQLLADADVAVDSLPEADRGPFVPRLDRARHIIDHHPARAAALLYQLLSTLDEHLA